ncbi:MAG: hypothetical protein ABR907_16895 [Terracidiphilus sp.]
MAARADEEIIECQDALPILQARLGHRNLSHVLLSSKYSRNRTPHI